MKRIPRPQGLTYLNKQIHNKQEEPIKFLKFIVQNYLNNHFTLNRQQVTVEQLADIIKAPLSVVLKEVLRQSKHYAGLLKPEQFEQVLFSTISKALFWASEDRYIAEEQVRCLTKSQRGSYKPFITSEVNRAISNLGASTGNLIGIFKGIPQPKSPPQALPQKGTIKEVPNEPNPNSNLLTVNEAFNLISSGSMTPTIDPAIIKELGTLPEVVANPTGDVPIPAKPKTLPSSDTPATK